MTNLIDFVRLVESVESLGGQAPPSITAVLESVKAWKAAAQGKPYHPPDVMKASIQRAAKRGRPISKEQVWDIVDEAVSGAGGVGPFGPALMGLDGEVVKIIQGLLQGEAGDELVGSLGEPVEEAVSGIREAASHYGPDTTAATVIDLGLEAVQAWKAAEGHGAYLDRVLNEVLRPLTIMELLPPEARRDFGHLILAGWIVKGADQLGPVGALLSQPTTSFKVPGGRWLRIYQINGIRLNSPREAAEIFAEIEAVEKELAAERQRQAEMRVANFGTGRVHTVNR